MSPAMFDLACKQLSHVKCVSLPTSEWVSNSLTLLDFDTKQHIPESPAAPDVYTESRNKNNYNCGLLAVLNISKSAEANQSHFCRNLWWSFPFLTASWPVCRKQTTLYAFLNCSAPTWKKKSQQIGSAKVVSFGVKYGNVFKMFHFRILWGKQAN